MSIKDQIREYIAAELGWDKPASELSDDYELLEKDVVDSLGIFKIISFIEEEWDVEVDDDELVPENFETISSIAGLVSAKV
ncbi:MAG: acyl carrier protein [Acidimicrobiia bacterium]|nr:acyl carrier protein [Acidimicrobiia bacterium]